MRVEDGAGRRQPGRRAGAPGHRRDPRHRLAGEVAARPRAGRQADHHLGRRPHRRAAAEGHDRGRRRRGRRRVRVDVPRPRREDDAARVPARRSCRSRTARSARRWSGASRAAA